MVSLAFVVVSRKNLEAFADTPHASSSLKNFHEVRAANGKVLAIGGLVAMAEETPISAWHWPSTSSRGCGKTSNCW